MIFLFSYYFQFIFNIFTIFLNFELLSIFFEKNRNQIFNNLYHSLNHLDMTDIDTFVLFAFISILGRDSSKPNLA